MKPIDLTLDEEGDEDPVLNFIISLNLEVNVMEILSIIKDAGAKTLIGLDLLAAAAQNNWEMFETCVLLDLKRKDITSWITIARGLKNLKRELK